MKTAVRLAGALMLVGTVAVSGQQPVLPPGPPPSGLILGRITDVSSGKAVSAAFVTLTLAGGPAARLADITTLPRFPLRVLTDGDGRFLFHDLPRGTYSLTATKAGYGPTTFGRQSPLDTTTSTLPLNDGEHRSDVTLVMWKLAAIAGTVTDEANEPVVGLPVHVMRRTFIGGRPRFTDADTVTTDDRGMYRSGSLAPGDYIVGIIDTETTVSLAWQSAAFAAMRTDGQAFNREVARSPVPAVNQMNAGQRVGGLSVSNGLGFGFATPPVNGENVFVYPTTFFPSAATPSKSTIVTVGSGDARGGVDFQVRPAPTGRISGTISGPDGPEGGIGLELIGAGTDEADRDPVFAAAAGVSDPDGTFTMLGVPPGNYLLRVQKNPRVPPPTGASTVVRTADSRITTSTAGALPPVSDEPTLWAQVPVSVTGQDVTNLAVVLRTGMRLSGRVEFIGSRPQPTAAQLADMAVSLQAAGGRTQAALTINGGNFNFTRGSVDANGQFKTFQFPPGRFVVRVTSPPPGWLFAGATLRGRDIADGPVEVNGEDLPDIVLRMTDRLSELSGNVRGTQGPDLSATVLIFPADSAAWMDYGPTPRRLRLVRPSNDGSHRASGFPAGEYLAIAIHSAVPSTWTDPSFLQKVAPEAVRVMLADGERKVQDLKSQEVR